MKNDKTMETNDKNIVPALRRICEHLGAQRRAHYHDTMAGGCAHYDPPYVLEQEYAALKAFLERSDAEDRRLEAAERRVVELRAENAQLRKQLYEVIWNGKAAIGD